MELSDAAVQIYWVCIISTTDAALMPLALAAVTVPSLSKAGRSLATDS